MSDELNEIKTELSQIRESQQILTQVSAGTQQNLLLITERLDQLIAICQNNQREIRQIWDYLLTQSKNGGN